MTKKYTIGIDMGINNVGWSVLDNESNKIIDYGVRLFNPSSGASDRRTARDTRRRMKRKDTRKEDTLNLLNKISFPNTITTDNDLITKRYKGLTEKISKQDITNILCYMVTHRGYIPFGDEEESFIELNGKLPCEFYYDMYQKENKYRNSNKVVRNTDNLKEIRTLLNTQKQFYKELTAEFASQYETIFTRKRKFWEGPGSINQLTPFGRFKTKEDVEQYSLNKDKNPNYEKYIFEDLIGNCKVSIGEKCAPRLNIYFELFNLYNDFINISFKNIDDIENKDCFNEVKSGKFKDLYKLNKKGLNLIEQYCLENYKISSYKVIFKDVFKTDIDNVVGYRKNKDQKPEFSTLNSYRKILKVFKENNFNTSWIDDIDAYNEIVYIMNVAPGTVEFNSMLEKNSKIPYTFNAKEKEALNDLRISFKKGQALGYASLSEKTLKRAINDMLSLEMNYMQVKELNNYDSEAKEYYINEYKESNFKEPRIKDDFVDDIISSPQVKKSLRQSIGIINALIKKYGRPTNIAIESTKDLNGKDMKAEIEKEQRLQEKLRKDAIEFISSNFGEDKVNETNITKVMLYNETDGHCMYCNNHIDVNTIINENYQIEHILPLSKSLNDSYDNKTIACVKCNHDKTNRTPYQFLANSFSEFEKRVISNAKLTDSKKNNLLFKEDLDKYSTRFFNSNLRDTAYATTELIKQINIFNYYLESLKLPRINTLSTPGQITHKLRNNNNLDKDRDIGKFHHAVDASIVASIATTNIGKIIIESQNDKQFWFKNKNKKLEDYALQLKSVNLKETIEQIKQINEDNTKYSCQVVKNPQRKLSNANLYKSIRKDNDYYKIDQIDNIYEYDFYNKNNKAKFETLLNENDSTLTLLCQDNDKDTFNYLKDIYNKYEPEITRIMESKAKEEKINPFILYLIDNGELKEAKDFNSNINGIHMVSKGGNGPIIKRLRYYSNVNDVYLLNKNNIKLKPNNIILLDSLSQFCTRVFVDKDTNKFVFLPVYCISVNLNTKLVNEDNEYYKLFYDKYISNKNVEHIVDLYNGNIIEITKKDNQVVKSIYEYYHKTLNKVILKSGDAFTQSDKAITVYDTDILGNAKKRLTYEIK